MPWLPSTLWAWAPGSPACPAAWPPSWARSGLASPPGRPSSCRSPGCCWPIRIWSSSTNPRAGSTRAPRRWWSGQAPPCLPGGPPSSSPIGWPPSSTWTTSPSSKAAASPSRAPVPKWHPIRTPASTGCSSPPGLPREQQRAHNPLPAHRRLAGRPAHRLVPPLEVPARRDGLGDQPHAPLGHGAPPQGGLRRAEPPPAGDVLRPQPPRRPAGGGAGPRRGLLDGHGRVAVVVAGGGRMAAGQHAGRRAGLAGASVGAATGLGRGGDQPLPRRRRGPGVVRRRLGRCGRRDRLHRGGAGHHVLDQPGDQSDGRTPPHRGDGGNTGSVACDPQLPPAHAGVGGSVTDLVADLFAGVLTIKASGAEERAVARLRARNDTRRTAAVRAQLARDLINTVSGVSVSITTGLVLLLAAGAMRAGRFSVGDLALFMSYSDALTGLPRWAGRMLARQREAGVALNRLGRMQPGRRPEAVLAPRPVYLRSEPPPASPAPSVLPRLALLEARALRAAHPSGRGVFDVELSVAAGGLTVITGAVGSGKTTLLRALLGLVPLDGGTVTWNGVPIEDLGAGLSPPRAAYVAQIPRLISAPLLENLLLGWTPMTEGVDEAIASVQLGPDLAEMTQGLQTTIGPRGSRLSGGQAQRVAIARSLVRRPDLLVIDDISSALDPPTEAAVWESLRRQGCACLVVSHRRYALDAADLVVVLDRGHQVGAGTFVELSDHPELRRLGMFAPSTPTGVPEA